MKSGPGNRGRHFWWSTHEQRLADRPTASASRLARNDDPFVLATLALGSGVYTYLGVRDLLDGSATAVFFAAVIYAVSVSVAIYGFWTYLIRLLPEMRDAASRLMLVAIMAVGSAMIVAMASWLNAAALAGSAAVEQHLAVTLQDYTADLDRGALQRHGRAVAAARTAPRRRALRPPCRRRAGDGRTHRHDRLGQRRPAPHPDGGADAGVGDHHWSPPARPCRRGSPRAN